MRKHMGCTCGVVFVLFLAVVFYMELIHQPATAAPTSKSPGPSEQDIALMENCMAKAIKIVDKRFPGIRFHPIQEEIRHLTISGIATTLFNATKDMD